uniref:Secreted protein n=1 Tax=Arachis duranensis TaxID=130453 RepID=N1NFT9_ARADU|nr:hypothetical protein ARAX_ADH035P21-017 [Arachis duranensis]
MSCLHQVLFYAILPPFILDTAIVAGNKVSRHHHRPSSTNPVRRIAVPSLPRCCITTPLSTMRCDSSLTIARRCSSR